MSWQSMGAILASKAEGNVYKVLHILAYHATADGLVDPAPGQDRIADILDVTPRSVGRYIGLLIESGEVKLERPHGGRGRPPAYRIMLKMEDVPHLAKGRQFGGGNSEKVDKQSADLSTFLPQKNDNTQGEGGDRIERIEQKVDSLLVMIRELITGLSTFLEKGRQKRSTRATRNGKKVDRKGRQGRQGLGENEPWNRIEPVFEPGTGEEKSIRPTVKIQPPAQNPPPPKIYGKRSFDPDNPVDARIMAVAKVCGKDVEKYHQHLVDCENAAAQLSHHEAGWLLARYGLPPATAPPHFWNWYLNDFRGQKGSKPTPKQLIETITNTPPIKLTGEKNGQNSGYSAKGKNANHPAFKQNDDEALAEWNNAKPLDDL